MRMNTYAPVRLGHLERGQESGQSIVIVAIMSMFLIAFLAIVLEVGLVLTQKRNLQNSADAAALAGAQELDGTSSGDAPAQAAAATYADENVADLLSFNSSVTGSHTQISVTVQKKSKTVFSGWLSFGEPTVTARATARIAAAQTPGPGVVPIGISFDTYQSAQNGALITLKYPGGSGTTGNYGTISIFGASGNEIPDYIRSGSPNPITDGYPNCPNNDQEQCTYSDTGNQSAMRDAVHDRMNAAAANNCATLSQVAPNGTLIDACNPLKGAKATMINGELVQPTAVILIPVLTNATFEPPPNGHDEVDIYEPGTDGERLFAFFLIDQSTVQAVTGEADSPYCPDNGGGGGGGGGGQGQCDIRGTFLESFEAALVAGGIPVGDIDENTVAKVVQLIK